MCSNCLMGGKHAQIMDYQWMDINPMREQLVQKHFLVVNVRNAQLEDEWCWVAFPNVRSYAGVVQN